MLGILPLADSLSLSLYSLYGLAAAAGWLSGNLYILRSRGIPGPMRRRILIIYWLGPPSLVFLLRAMAPAAAQQAAPLVSIYAFGVFSVFFLVPVTLKAGFQAR
jgi:hypothetical protein